MNTRYRSVVSFKSALGGVVLALVGSAGCGTKTTTPCPVHAHGHDHSPSSTAAPGARVISHEDLQVFENSGNELVGVATKSMGAQNFEVWRTSVAPGSATPPHRHESEEIFIFLRGQGRAKIGDEIIEFSAPATVIAPAGVEHQFENTGDTKTDAIVVVGIGSQIYDRDGKEMTLPWRK